MRSQQTRPNLNRSSFVNTKEIEASKETEETVSKENIKKFKSYCLEAAISIMNQNNKSKKRGRKKEIFNKTQKSRLYNIDIQTQVEIEAITYKLIHRLEVFMESWKKTGKVLWKAELYGYMASVLKDISQEIEEKSSKGKWPVFLERDTNG